MEVETCIARSKSSASARSRRLSRHERSKRPRGHSIAIVADRRDFKGNTADSPKDRTALLLTSLRLAKFMKSEKSERSAYLFAELKAGATRVRVERRLRRHYRPIYYSALGDNAP
jgi:hypothetical protein